MANESPSSASLDERSQTEPGHVSLLERNSMSSVRRSGSTSGTQINQLSPARIDSGSNVPSWPSSTGSPASFHESPKKSITRRKQRFSLIHRASSMGWWWEVASTFLAVTCMSLIVAILFYMDNKSTDNWQLPIQPNSLVAVFSTVAKSAILFPLSECIGQLKWEHFDTLSAKTLNELHAFDTASRGPWGALKLTWITRGRAILASVGAIVIVLMLAFEPFTQQIISISARNALLRNETATVIVTNAWYQPPASYFVEEYGDYEKAVYPLTAAILGSLTQSAPREPASAYCPALKCEFPDFTTLGVCSQCTFTAINNDSFDKCYYTVSRSDSYGNLSQSQQSSYENLSQFQQALVEEIEKQGQEDFPEVDGNVRCEKYVEQMIYNITERVPLYFEAIINYNDTTRPPWMSLRLINSSTYQVQQGSAGSNERLDDAGVSYLQTFYQINGSTVFDPQTNAPDPQTLVTTTSSFRGFNSTTDFSLYSQVDQIGVINGSISSCDLNFCALTYRNAIMDNGRWSFSSIEETALQYLQEEKNGNTSTNITFTTSGIAGHFRIGIIGWLSLRRIIATAFENEPFQQALHSEPFNNTINGNWTEYSRQLASAISSIIQSPGNSDAKNITGDVYGHEVYIRVRWLWFSGPLAMVALSIVFLILTIIKSSQKEYLFKTSILAIMFHGLEGLDVSDSQTEINGRKKTDSELLKLSKGIRVSLRKNNEGSLKLKKE